MVRKLYLEDASPLVADVKIMYIGLGAGHRPFVCLDVGIFHPAGGGQKADQGRLGLAHVVGVRKTEDGEIEHYVDQLPSDWKVGDIMNATVDRAGRQLNCALHTAGQLLSHCTEAC